MADIQKPDMSKQWANSGNKTPPSDSLINTGWSSGDIPTNTDFNYIDSRQDQGLAYILQKGIVEWDNATEYVVGKSWVQYAGNLYVCIQTATNKQPNLFPAFWTRIESIFKYTANTPYSVEKTFISRVNTDYVYVTDNNVTPDAADNRSNFMALVEWAAAENKTVYVPDGVYNFSDWVPLPSKLKLVCSPNSWFKLTTDTGPIGGFLIGGYDSSLVKRQFADVEIHNIGLDLNNIAGENGFNAVAADNVKLFNPRIKNVKRSTTRLGGRAFQFEGGVIDGIHIFNPYIQNCSIGINSQGRPDGTEVARNINYYNVVMRGVDIPFNIDSQFANPSTNTPNTMSTTVFGAQLYNCGRITWAGDTSSGLGGGIVCGDRGSGLSINNMKIVNSSTYGGIGSLTRGLIYDVSLNNVEIHTPSLVAVFDFATVGFGSAAASSDPARVSANNISVVSNIDYIVKGGAANDRIGKSVFNVQIDSTQATLTALVDNNAGSGSSGTSAYLNLRLSDQGFTESGLRSLANLLISSNNVGECQPSFSSGSWLPSDQSGAGLTFSVIGTPRYERRGRLVTAFVGVTYPTTTDTQNARIGGLPFVAANFSNAAGGASINYKSVAALSSAYVQGSTSSMVLTDANGVPVTNAQLSASTIYLTITYLA